MQTGTLNPRRVDLPCSIGDTVWCVFRRGSTKRVVSGVVSQMFFTESMKLCIVVRHMCRGQWMEQVFPDEKTAELALANLKEGNRGAV